MAKRTRYTPEFKAEVVLEALSGESSQAELCRRYNLSEQQLSKWKQQAIENFASVFGSKDKASAADASRIAHLEQLVGRLTVALDIEKQVPRSGCPNGVKETRNGGKSAQRFFIFDSADL